MITQKKELPYHYQGLCTLCIHAAQCTFPRAPDHPIKHCDEFEGEQNQTTEVAHPEKRKLFVHYNTKQETLTHSEMPGLCSNCNHRDMCTFPRSSHGVWQCEEYE